MSRVTAKCYQARPADVKPAWHVVDAEGKVLGRLAAQLATILMGKHKPTYTPHVDCGDFVIVTNAAKVKLTGRKAESMEYASYSYYPGGRRVVPFGTMLSRHPDRIIRYAVRRMLPKNSMGRRMLTRLKIYAGPDHRHQAQNPQPLKQVFYRG